MTAARAAHLNVALRMLEEQLDQTIANLIDDLTFQSIPIHKIRGPENMGDLHLVEHTREDSEERSTSFHPAEGCHSCNARFPARRLKYGRKGRGRWQTYRGTYEVAARHEHSYDDIDRKHTWTYLYVPKDAFARRPEAVA